MSFLSPGADSFKLNKRRDTRGFFNMTYYFWLGRDAEEFHTWNWVARPWGHGPFETNTHA